MIDKRKTSRLVKIVSLFVALSFVLSLLPVVGVGGRNMSGTSGMPSGSQSGQATGASRVPAAKPKSDREKAMDLIGQGEQNEKSGNFSQALAYYKDAVDMDPTYATSHFLLGRAAARAGEEALAESSLKKYLALEPKGEYSAEARSLLGDSK